MGKRGRRFTSPTSNPMPGFREVRVLREEMQFKEQTIRGKSARFPGKMDDPLLPKTLSNL
jgi:hypothetical protein